MSTQENQNPRFTLTQQEDLLAICDTQNKFKPISIDFNKLDHDWKFKSIGKNFDLCKAVGIKKINADHQDQLTVLDATAGLGGDSFILAKMGCLVTMLERNHSLAQMLESALSNYQSNHVKNNLQFIHTSAFEFLTTCQQFNIIYLDPMFPEKNNSALVKKEMQILQELIGSDSDSDQLLNLALAKATNRVVVKRPKGAAYLAEKKPSYEIKGKSVRYDVYLNTQRTIPRDST